MNTVTSRCLHLDLSALVAAAGARRVVDPVQDDEGQAADHEHDPHDQEDGRLRGETPGVISRPGGHWRGVVWRLTPIFCGERSGTDWTRRR